MATILAYTSPAKGHVYPAAAILAELRSRGHRVHARVPASEVEPLRTAGFEAAALAPAVEEVAMDDWQQRGSRKSLAAAVATFTARAPFDAEDLTAAIGEVGPDVVLVDINAWGALAAAERWGGRWATFCPYPLALPAAEVPPYGPGLRPAHGRLGRARDRIVGPLVNGTLQKAMLPGINEVRSRRGLPALSRLEDQFLRPEMLLYLTAEPFEYHRCSWPDNVRMVGPCEWEPPVTVPDWLQETKRPLVVVTTSSEFQDDHRLVRAALAGLADEPVSVVATVPAGRPSDFALTSNARVESFVSHSVLFAKADCVITHGGMGATQKALARGVPVCAVPFGRDQFEVARRVETARAGSRLPSGRLSPARLRGKVLEAMAMRDGARAVADGYARAGGPAAAADALESLVRPAVA
jgi:MGT family glycosyltransferase